MERAGPEVSPLAFLRTTYQPGEEIDWEHGIFRLDAATGQVDVAQLDEAQVGGGFGVIYDLFDGRYLVALLISSSGGTWLYDPLTGRSLHWSQKDFDFVSISDRVLVMLRRQMSVPGTSAYSAFLLPGGEGDAAVQEVATFELAVDPEDEWPTHPILLNVDRRFVLIANKRVSSIIGGLDALLSVGGEIMIASSEDGSSRTVLSLPDSSHAYGYRDDGASVLFLVETQGTSGIESLTSYEVDWAGSEEAETLWEVATHRAVAVRLSPDGRYLAAEYLDAPVEAGFNDRYLSSVTVFDVQRNEAMFILRSAAFSGPALGDRSFPVWLAESTGFVVQVPPEAPGGQSERDCCLGHRQRGGSGGHLLPTRTAR